MERLDLPVPGLLKTILKSVLYKEPNNEELGFELLEGENEGVEQESPQNASGKGDQKASTGQRDDSRQQGNAEQKRNDRQQSDTNHQGDKKMQGNIKTQRKNFRKQPLKVDEWNGNRKTENTGNTCKPQNNSDILSTELCSNLETIRQKFLIPKNQDVITREFKIGRKIKAFMVYVEGMIDKNTMNLAIFPHLMSKDVFEEIGEDCPVDYLMENVLTVHNVRKTDKYSYTVMQVLNGMSALFVEGCGECILMETRGFEKRNVGKPITETVVKGSQEGFTENLRTNVTLVRKIIKNENLVTEMLPIGNTNHSNCAVMYLEGIANTKVIQEVKKRIKKIDSDFVLGDGMVEQFIEDNPFMLFPQVIDTERPDRTASFIMEGQVVIIAEGAPFALAVPVTFFRLFHTSEDSFVRWPASNFLRYIRLLGLFCATFLPGMYVALTLFHTEMIPTELLIFIAGAKELVPFPTILEVMMMEISFELIREGGIRVPSIIGQTLGIVGALILGQAAVAAGLVSPLLVIVVSITGLGSFAIPNYTLAIAVRIERFLFIFAGAVLGFYGISLMAMLLAYFACSMKSFGVPFLSPVAPKTNVNPDVIYRHPIWSQKNRPDYMNAYNRKRQGNNQKLWISEDDQDKKGKEDKT
ncbi:MAG: spore germination protein [Ruminiclostridium sp.]|nr:spore germination protein [Ruminiclostridium sp.]